MIIHNCPQGSDEWLALRLGKVTASRFGDVMAEGQGKTRKAYMKSLFTELDEHRVVPTYQDKNMLDGTKKEPLARKYYENVNHCIVEQVGFIELNEWVGGSPDGLVGEDGLIEIKCPIATTHYDYRKGIQKPSKAYIEQMQGLMWITGRKWCDFVSFRPESEHPYWSTTFMRDEKHITELEIQITMFVTDLKKMIEEDTITKF